MAREEKRRERTLLADELRLFALEIVMRPKRICPLGHGVKA